MTLSKLILMPLFTLAIALGHAEAYGSNNSWTLPVAITASYCSQPSIAVDSNGHAIAIWQGFDGSNNIIQSSTRQDQGSWSTISTLSAAGNDANSPSIAIDAHGNAVAIWNRFDGEHSIVQSSICPCAGSWSTATNISDPYGNASAENLSLNSDDTSCTAVAIWLRFNGCNLIVQTATLHAGGCWSTSENISISGQDSLVPELALDLLGNAVAIWSRFDGSNFVINGASCLNGQNWSISVPLSASGELAYAADVATDAAGNALAAWSRFDGSNYIIQVADLPFGGSWSSPLNLSVAGQNAFSPQIAMNFNGDAIAFWVAFDGANYVLNFTRKPAGGYWSSAEAFTNTGRDVGNFNVAIDNEGQGVVVWDESDGQLSIVQAATSDSNGNWTPATQLSTADTAASSPVDNPANSPVVAIDPSGNATAIWIEWNGYNYEPVTASLLKQ